MKKQRCDECKKKLKTTIPITCKCDKYFCYTHNLPHDHNCTYDHVTEHKNKLEKQNQKVDHKKLEYM